MSQSTSQKHARLKKLSKETQNNIFEMLKLADEILKDREYVDQFGSQAALMDMLEETEFSHFGGKLSLQSMLRAYRANPDLKTWETNKFNLVVMIDLSEPSREKEEVERNDWKARFKEAEEEAAKWEARCVELESQVSELTANCDKLTGQVELLKDMQKKAA